MNKFFIDKNQKYFEQKWASASVPIQIINSLVIFRQKFIKETLTYNLTEGLKECEYEFNEKKGKYLRRREIPSPKSQS